MNIKNTIMSTKRFTESKKSTYVKVTHLDLFQRLSETHLLQINELFSKKDGKGFSKEHLKELLSRILAVEIDEQEFQIIFWQMNKEGSGFVDWDEFISYLIVQYQQKEVSLEYESLLPPISAKPRILKSNHRHPIIRVAFYPCIKLDGTVLGGNIVTCSKDGQISFWSIHMQLQRTCYSTSPDLKIQQTRITDMAVLPDVYVICTSSTERDLRFYDTSARKFALRVMFKSLSSAVSALTYHRTSSLGKESKLIFGDFSGRVGVIFIRTEARGPFRSKPGDPLLYARFDDVVKNLIPGFRVLLFKVCHTDFVRQVMYCSTLHTVISCAQCSTRAVIINDLGVSRETSILQVASGVWCFSMEKNIYAIATGGLDCLIRIWNPFVPTRPTAILYGHHTGIIRMTFQDSGKVLYSLSIDKSIKVWNVAQQSCVQSYSGLPTELGKRAALTTLYLPEKRSWIIGSNIIAVLPVSPQPNPEHTDGSTHSDGISVILYNSLYKFIITCGLDSYILVWSPWDGRRMLAIKDAHTKTLFGESVPVEITAACFGQSQLHLLTGANDGSIKIWDFTNGMCLRNLQIDSYNEIRSIMCEQKRIFACGWNRCLSEFSDITSHGIQGGTYGKNWDFLHDHEISCAALRTPQAIVSGSYEGELIFWRLETGQAYMRYFIYDPLTRIKLQYKGESRSKNEECDGIKYSRSSSRKKRWKKKSVGLMEKQDPESSPGFRMVSVTCMIFLNQREMEPNTGSLLVAVDDGSIQVWSHHGSGGFMERFFAIHKNEDYIVAMATDDKNEFLFTGSYKGYLKTWLLIDYCIPGEPPKISMPKYRLMFPFLWAPRFFKRRAARAVRNQPKPVLLNSFMGHLKPITSIIYLNDAQVVVSGSADKSARMWSLGGCFMQTLGTFKKWKPISANKPVDSTFEYTIPADLARKMSSTTLRVLSGGIVKRSRLTVDSLQTLKKNIQIDKRKTYGTELKDPILGNHFQIPNRIFTGVDIDLDTSFPYIPVYQHFIMKQEEELGRKHIADLTDRHREIQKQLAAKFVDTKPRDSTGLKVQYAE